MTVRTLSILILPLTVTCCSDRTSDTRFTAVEELASASPKEALDSLEVIDYNLLSDADKHYYDFLSVKVSDKAYITHVSDSLILKVIDYESRHQGNGRYPEALYYGGRVYHDLGNLPTALNYYQNALDNIPENEDRNPLRGRILSQIGGLLKSLRLYGQAIPYVKEVIALDSIRNDSINLIYDLELLGAIYLHAKDFDSAERLFNRAKFLAKIPSSADTIRHNMYLAAIKYNKGQIDSALKLIRPTVMERERIKTEAANERLRNWLGGFLLVVLVLSIYILYSKNRNKSQLIQLHDSINNINILLQTLNKSETKNQDLSGIVQGIQSESDMPFDNPTPNIQDLRIRLREELLSIRYTGNQSHAVSPIILESDAYEKVLQYIKNGRIIPEKSPLWVELENIVLKSSKDFKYRLHLLTGGKLKSSDFHMALLIKCGISSTDMSTLVGRAKSTIVYRKDSLSIKVFDQKIGIGVIDDIIHLL